MTVSIYWGYDDRLEQQNTLLDREPHHPENRVLIHRYQDYLARNGRTGQSRVSKLTAGLRMASLRLKKPFTQATQADAEVLLSSLLSEVTSRGNPISDNTKRDRKRCMKQFYRWIERDQEPTPVLAKTCAYFREVKTPDPKPRHSPGECLTEEDIQTVLDKGCTAHLERALISTLFESGCRIGEILGARIRDVQDEPDIWVLTVDGKTGERAVPLIHSIPYITRWLTFHPNRTDPDAPLWVSTHNRWHGQPLRYIGARHLLNRCFNRAGLKKRHNPHWWRHSRATIDARDSNYTDTILCRKMGHSLKVAARYRHMTADDVKNAVRRAAGLTIPEDTKKHSLLPQQCRECGEINTRESLYCAKCGKALGAKATEAERDYTRLAFDLLTKIMSDKGLQEQFEAFKQTQEAKR